MLKKFSLITLLLALSVCYASAQSLKDLEKKRKEAQKKLEVTTKLLKENNKSQKNSINKIYILQQNIRERERMMSTINQELKLIDEITDSLQTERTALMQKLEQLKINYAQLVQKTHSYNNTFSYLSFLLSAKNFNQMYKRYLYLQQFAAYRKQQITEIEMITQLIADKEQEMALKKSQKNEVLYIKQQETNKLEADKKSENRTLIEIKQKEKKLIEQQKKQQRLADDLNRKIKEIIDAEVKKSQKKSQTKTSEIKLTKEEQLIAGNFEKNKGRLPWPVAEGFISGKFGKQPHPVLQHVTLDNKGIFIQTNKGSDARAIFEGVVTQCFTVPGSNNAVIIQHGNYRSVYTNLTQLYVKVGDKVTAKQKIGKIFVNADEGNKTEMQLMLYLNTTLLNPEPWLAK